MALPMMRLAVPGGFAEPTNIKDVIDLYLRHAATEIVQAAFESRRYELTDFAGQFGALALKDGRPYHLQLWIDSHPAWRSGWTRKRCVAGVQRAFNWAVKLGLITSNPFKGFSIEAGGRGEPMHLKEYQGVLRHSPPPFRRFVIGLRFTGCRPGELAKATWGDVDFNRACIILDQHKTVKKTGKPRVIILHPVMLKLLAWQRRRSMASRFFGDIGPKTLLFPNGKGGKWTNPAICWHVARMREKGVIGPTTTLYGLRFLYAVQATKAGVELLTLMPLMGHTQPKTTAYYADMAKQTDHLQAAVVKSFKHHSNSSGSG